MFALHLQYHSDKLDVWTRIILFEYNENASDERVKGLLLRAQQLHGESLKLYLIFFQIELENKREADPELALQHATIVYTGGKKKFPNNFNYFLEMLQMVDKFEYARSIQTMILKDMTEIFANAEIMWHTFAQRERNGLATDNFNEKVRGRRRNSSVDGDQCMSGLEDNFKMNLEIIKSDDPTLRKQIECSVQIYEESVKEVCVSKFIW